MSEYWTFNLFSTKFMNCHHTGLWLTFVAVRATSVYDSNLLSTSVSNATHLGSLAVGLSGPRPFVRWYIVRFSLISLIDRLIKTALLAMLGRSVYGLCLFSDQLKCVNFQTQSISIRLYHDLLYVNIVLNLGILYYLYATNKLLKPFCFHCGFKPSIWVIRTCWLYFDVF